MADSPEVATSVEYLRLDDISSQVREIEEAHKSCSDDLQEKCISDADGVLEEWALRFDSRVGEIVAEYSSTGLMDTEDSERQFMAEEIKAILDTYREVLTGAYLEQLRSELYATEAEAAKISEEINLLSKSHAEGSSRLDRDLEVLWSTLDILTPQEPKKDPTAKCPSHEEQTNGDGGLEFQTTELESQIEENKKVLKSLQDLHFERKRLEAAEQIEDALKGLKVIEYTQNCIKLSLHTYIPKLDGQVDQPRDENMIEPSELHHELVIELIDKAVEVENIEIFPNDVYIGDIVDSEKSFRQISSQMPLLSLSSLDWFVGKVQERIIFVTLQKIVVKRANKLRYPLEYFDREQIIIAHLNGGVDAFISPPHGWPLMNLPLKLASIKNSDKHARGISLHLCCQVEELANSLDLNIRKTLSSFVEGVEKIIMEQIRLELRYNDITKCE